MSLQKCDDCRKKVSSRAGTCPNCGAPVVPKQKKRRPFRGIRNFFISAFWVFVVFMVMGAISGNGSDSKAFVASGGSITTPTGYVIDKHGAVASCQMQVEDSLKSPKTAKFPNPWASESSKPKLKGNTWEQIVTVDSQNGFGALIRSSWLCVIDGSDGMVQAVQID